MARSDRDDQAEKKIRLKKTTCFWIRWFFLNMSLSEMELGF